MTFARVAAVTGANKGIGLAIVRNLALQYPKSKLCQGGPLLIYLTARNEERGRVALSQIYDDPALASAKALRKDGGLTDVEYRQLDVSASDSIKSFASFMSERHPAGIDILVNNAGVMVSSPFSSNSVRETLACNYYGTLQVTEAMLPHIRDGGRVVNLSSMLGKLNKYSPEVTAAFKKAATGGGEEGGVESVTRLMNTFQQSVDKGTPVEDGWPRNAYCVSKAGVTGISMFLGRQEALKGRGVLLNACCPGYVKTDMTDHRARKTPDQGAQTPVHLALGDLNGVSGEFWEWEEDAKMPVHLALDSLKGVSAEFWEWEWEEVISW